MTITPSGKSEDPQQPAAVSPPADPQQIDMIVQVVLARMEQHLHLPITLPPVAELEAYRERTPEAYHAMLDIAKEQSSTQAYVARAPMRMARAARLSAMFVVVAVLVFCGYLAHEGHEKLATTIAALDLVGLVVAIVGSGEPNHDGRHASS